MSALRIDLTAPGIQSFVTLVNADAAFDTFGQTASDSLLSFGVQVAQVQSWLLPLTAHLLA